METADTQLVEELTPHNDELRRLMADHEHLERQIDEFKSRAWLSGGDQHRIRELKKRKLRGRDRVEEILRGYRIRVASG